MSFNCNKFLKFVWHRVIIIFAFSHFAIIDSFPIIIIIKLTKKKVSRILNNSSVQAKGHQYYCATLATMI